MNGKDIIRELLDMGFLTSDHVAEMAIRYMSSADIEDMLNVNDVCLPHQVK
tara:strand:+ start:1138 stop:1290 length:153 start_codon:yes stop_codon:yes gene_type:complete